MSNIAARERLVKYLMWAFTAQILLTSFHHLYGGLMYESAARVAMPIFAFVELLIVLALLFRYRQSGSGIALVLYSVIATLVGVVQGAFHTLYGHLYKDVLFLVGVPAETVRDYFFPILPNDFHYPPNNLLFEATGLLELVTILLIALFTYRLIENWRLEKKMGTAPATSRATESANG